MKSFYQGALEYNYHFNQKLADSMLEKQNMVSEKSLTLFCHIVNAQHIWVSRLSGQPSRFGVWEVQPIPKLKELDLNNFNDCKNVLEQSDLTRSIQYQNSRGEVFENKISDIFFHIINHATYHRGQIAMDFRQHNLEPLNSDYIFYKR